MADEWEIVRTTGKCAATGREFAEGDAYYAVLFEGPEGFERRDYSEEAWSSPPENSFCYWRGRIPIREQKPTAVNIDHAVLTHLFCNLEDEQSEGKQRFRFLLALLLMRKRILKLDKTIRDGENEYWQVRMVSDQNTYRVLNPRLTPEEVDRLGNQLTALLSGEEDPLKAPKKDDSQETQEDPSADAEPDAGESAAESEGEVATS